MVQIIEKEDIKHLGPTLLNQMLKHSYDFGGTVCEILGSQGSGKTSVLLSFCTHAMNTYPNEKIFFSNCFKVPLQFVKLGEGKYHSMVQENSGVSFHDRNNKLKRIYPPVTTFTTFDDLYENAIPGICNGVFFADRATWMKFIGYLQSVGEWTWIFIDEMSEIAPSFQGGKAWKDIGEFSITLKESRKAMQCLFFNTQSPIDIDHRVRTKIMTRIFLPGARSEQQARVHQDAIDNLHINRVTGNEAYIDSNGRFGMVTFKDIFKPIPSIQIEARNDGIIK